MPSQSQCLTLLSKSIIFPDSESKIGDLKLSVSDLPMLSTHYIQKGCLFTRPSLPIESLIPLLKLGLSKTLSFFPPLAGRLITDSDGYVYITCNDAGVEFYHVSHTKWTIQDVISPIHTPDFVRGFFPFDRTVSYSGHFKPIMAVQVTELADGMFIGCAVNHAVTDGTSLWNFFNSFAEVCRKIGSGIEVEKIARQPDFTRDLVLISPVVLRVPEGGPKVTFDENAPLRERIFSFSREAISELKAIVNGRKWIGDDGLDAVEIMGKQSNDKYNEINGKNMTAAGILENWLFKTNAVLKTETEAKTSAEISSFQSLCALLWRAVTRARKLPASKTTTFRMAVNVRPRLNPKLDPLYFGNAIQSIPVYAAAADVTSRDLRWCAEQLNEAVKAYDDDAVRRVVSDWEKNPRCFPLGNFDGAIITMGSSPRFPMFDNDFGWGRPLAVRSGKANKFDGKISAFPGREGNGSVDLEVLLSPETMAGIEADSEFMKYVTS